MIILLLILLTGCAEGIEPLSNPYFRTIGSELLTLKESKDIYIHQSVPEIQRKQIIRAIDELNVEIGFTMFRYKEMDLGPLSARQDGKFVIYNTDDTPQRLGHAKLTWFGSKISECDIIINKNKLFFYDQPVNNLYDFNGLIKHELAHCFGMMHTKTGRMSEGSLPGKYVDSFTEDELYYIRKAYGR